MYIGIYISYDLLVQYIQDMANLRMTMKSVA